jgi:hypothetical protein
MVQRSAHYSYLGAPPGPHGALGALGARVTVCVGPGPVLIGSPIPDLVPWRNVLDEPHRSLWHASARQAKRTTGRAAERRRPVVVGQLQVVPLSLKPVGAAALPVWLA